MALTMPSHQDIDDSYAIEEESSITSSLKGDHPDSVSLELPTESVLRQIGK